MPSPYYTICHHTNVVYETTCNLCQLTYIGQTKRHLHDRAREHLTAATHKQRTSALVEHYADSHPNSTPDLSFTILRTNPDALRLHIEEEFCIQALKPPLNRRQEHLGTGFLPRTPHPLHPTLFLFPLRLSIVPPFHLHSFSIQPLQTYPRTNTLTHTYAP